MEIYMDDDERMRNRNKTNQHYFNTKFFIQTFL